MEEIPVIDISPFLSTSAENINKVQEKLKVAQAWNDAFSNLGFAYITGHGVPEEIIENLYRDSVMFFKQETEQKLMFDLHKGYGDGGYCRIGGEAVGRTMVFNEKDKSSNYITSPTDLVESFEVVREDGGLGYTPEGPPVLEKSLKAYWFCMCELLDILMEISGLALGLKEDFFQPFHTNPFEILRLAFYPAQDKTKPVTGQLRYGPHTDYMGYTILYQDDTPGGLEASGSEKGTWIPVKPKKGTFVINTGDAIQQWTNDQWKANLHRVANPPKSHCDKHRLSMVFFSGTNMDAIIEPLSVCCSKDNPPKYLPISTKELYRNKIDVSQGTDDDKK